jgi:hypothetical protein
MGLRKNMGTTDRVIRVVLVVAIAALLITDVFTGTLAMVLGIVAIVLLLTSLWSFCPLYWPFKLSTRGHRQSHAQEH